ncbi:TIGR00375 family protein [Methanosarcina sp.]|uniref:TIGR00375 family protein n=1 Tax=Methanosarcina sp. TaxID=2213 RepID=UPI002988B7E8|nr:TIGR00375 family protein [Methanosarcina sp.]MDW5549480.1 TIGR00375 family protein [Methanosarcina sp.]MDW5553514.1 TIGR00375 family protein [Methanosarcina sp.]MDW5558681.1 TIGR00375 family protein [Methanosarcina sp.]
MKVNTDLHLHSKYSMASSKKMELPTIAREASKKGMELIGTADCTHPKWLEEIKRVSVSDEEIRIDEIYFIPTTEVEDSNRVHHLLILPSISKAEELAERIAPFGNLEADGRPSIRLNGSEIAEIAKDLGALIGPCHAFTPWTALYGYHDSLKSCYGDMTDYISFLELGLSADSDYADRIEELHRLTFLSNSDAHSPSTNKLAREFTQFDVPELTFDGLKKAILREQGYKATLNVGFFPEEGKYNRSACIKCFTQYPLPEAVENKWRCPICGGIIKKGVFDRVNELADFKEPKHPDYRPPYLHLIPLAEIIQMALGHASVQTKGVQTAWNKLIERFGNEVKALIYSEPEDLKVVGDDRIVNAILAFRKGNVIIHPGGGGQYGWLELPENLKNEEIRQTGQLSFSDLEETNPKKVSKPEKKREKRLRKENGETENEEQGNQKSNNGEPDDAGQSSLFDF